MDLVPLDESIDDYRSRNRPLLRGDRRGGSLGGRCGEEGIHVHVHLDGEELRGRRGRYSRREYERPDPPDYPDAPDAPDYLDPPDPEDAPYRRVLPGGVGPPPKGPPDPKVQAKVQTALTGRSAIGPPPTGVPDPAVQFKVQSALTGQGGAIGAPPGGLPAGALGMGGIGPPPSEGGYAGGAIGPPPLDIQYLTPGASTALVPVDAVGPPPEPVAMAPEMLEMGITPPTDAEPGLPKEPMEVICPNCGRQVFSKVKHRMGSGSWALTCAICVAGVGAFSWLGVMPCCLKDCQDSHHTCPDCEAELGTRKFLF